MSDVVIFGGTTEGRYISEYCGRAWMQTVVCVATSQGEESSIAAPSVRFHVGRMNTEQIKDFLVGDQARVVVDATHPYATEITANVANATTQLGLPLIRVARSGESSRTNSIHHFQDLETLVDWVNTTPGVIFATTGAKEAEVLARVKDFTERVYLRVLPVSDGIAQCTVLGYPTAHIIAMQGPFSEELNVAMFRQTGASILVTKDSGDAGGLPEKLNAAKVCSMTVAMVDRPEDNPGVSVEEACVLLVEALR